MKASTRLREMLATGKTYFVPGAYDGISARIVQNAGAELIYATGVALRAVPASPTWV